MSFDDADNLSEKIRRLQADRQRHIDAMAAIDRVLNRVDGVLRDSGQHRTGDLAAVSSSPADSPLHQQDRLPRRRGQFGRTGVESVLEFIRHQGNPSTAEINRHWRAEGRKGTANITLLMLLKGGRIRREADPSIRGSRYILFQSPVAATDPPPPPVPLS